MMFGVEDVQVDKEYCFDRQK